MKLNRKELLKDIKNNLLIKAIVMNALMFIVTQIFFKPTFESCDDNYMASIVYGAYGEYETRLLFMNILLGKAIKLLLFICPALPWYTIIQYSALFVAFTIIIYIILKNERNDYRYILSWVLLIVFGYEYYVNLQFSKTAGALTVAGVLWIYESIREKNIKKISLTLGIMLSVLGSFYRFSVFCMMLPIIGSIALFECLCYIKNKKYKVFGRACVIFISLFVACCIFKEYDTRVYQNDSQWQEYRSFESFRGELLDYGFPEYDKNKDIYQQAGMLSKNDLSLYTRWNYADPELFTENAMQTLIEAKESRELNIETLRTFLAQFPVYYLKYPYFAIFIGIFVLWLLSNRKNKVAAIFTLLACLGIEFYLYYAGRYFFNRIDVSVFFGLCVVLTLSIEHIYNDKLNKYIIGIIFGVVILNNNWFLNGVATSGVQEEKQEAREIFDIISSDKENLYMLENYTNDKLWTTAYSVWDVPPKGVAENYYVMGGWRYKTPLTEWTKKSYGVENPYRDVIDNDHVYIVNDSSMSSMVKYIREHYCPSAQAIMVKEINEHRFYKIVSQKVTLDTTKAKEFDGNIEYRFSVAGDQEGNPVLQGYVYKDGTDSYHQQVYIGKYDESAGKEIFYPARGMEKSSKESEERRYSWFLQPLADMNVYDIRSEKINIYLEVEGELYKQELKLD